MTVTINGTTGVAGVDGTAATPAIQGNDTNTGIFFPAADTIAFAEGGAEVARFDSSGNLGVNTTTPNTRVQSTVGSSGSGVVNALRLQNLGTTAGDGAKIVFTAGTSTDGAGIASTGVALDSADLRFYSGGNTERMRIDSSGRLILGDTGTAPYFDGRINSYGSGSVPAACFKNDGGGGQFTASMLNIALSGTRNLLQFVVTATTQVGLISSNGTSTTYGTSSDYRLKENIAPMTGALDKVALLKPCTYTWKESGEASQGFIAHELQAVCPDAVVGEKDAVNEDGSIKPQGIDTSFLVATLTAAIQEQQAIITDLKARIETLENK